MYNPFVSKKKAAPASAERANARAANAYPFVLLRRFLQLTGPGCHEMVQRVVGEYIKERDDGTAALNQPSAEVYICNVAELVFTDREEFRQFHAVSRRLIQHDEKLTVCQHSTRRMGLQQIVG